MRLKGLRKSVSVDAEEAAQMQARLRGLRKSISAEPPPPPSDGAEVQALREEVQSRSSEVQSLEEQLTRQKQVEAAQEELLMRAKRAHDAALQEIGAVRAALEAEKRAADSDARVSSGQASRSDAPDASGREVELRLTLQREYEGRLKALQGEFAAAQAASEAELRRVEAAHAEVLSRAKQANDASQRELGAARVALETEKCALEHARVRSQPPTAGGSDGEEVSRLKEENELLTTRLR
eukprot:5868918-Prymnesium_polylepis.2